MSGRPGDTPYPKALTYAMGLNMVLAAVLLAVTVIAYVVRVVVQGQTLQENDYQVFVHLNIIYALIIFLITLLIQTQIDKLPVFIERLGPNKDGETFFSRGYILFTIKLVALLTMAFGTLLFLFMMYGLALFAFPPAA